MMSFEIGREFIEETKTLELSARDPALSTTAFGTVKWFVRSGKVGQAQVASDMETREDPGDIQVNTNEYTTVYDTGYSRPRPGPDNAERRF